MAQIKSEFEMKNILTEYVLADMYK
jgi:hypothetical protein